MPSRSPIVHPLILLSALLAFPLVAAAADDPGPRDPLGSLLRSPCLRQARVAVRVVDLADGAVRYDLNGDRPLIPASNVKLFTAAAALKIFGPAHRFSTTFHADAAIGADGTLAGPLYLKGWGAPDLVGEYWWLMVEELRRLGLRRVEGDLLLDDTYFDAERRPSGWPRPVVDRAYNAPLGALSCNYNVVTVRVVPGDRVGTRPEVHLIPFRAHLGVRNQAATRNRRPRISAVRMPGGGEQILVSGSVRPGGRPVESIMSVDDPTRYAGHAFREAAASAGIEIGGAIRTGTVPDDAIELYRFRSKPLSAVLRDMNKYSNNFIAEMLVKGIDASAGTGPGTTAGGIAIIRDTLRAQGVELEGVEIRDGSGLADGNLATAAALTSTLVAFGRDFEVFPELLASLPVAGLDGTLEDRDAALRRVRAKTGRLSGADSLSGYAAGPAGELFAFSILVNGSPCDHDRVQPIIDRMAARIADGVGRE